MTDEQHADLQASASVLGCDLLVVPEGCETAFGSFLRSALGGGPRREGPPYEHRFGYPLRETDDSFEPEPPGAPFTLERAPDGKA